MRVHAEGADQILEFLCPIDDFGLVQLVGQMSKHLRRQLDAHPDVHAVGARGDLQVAADRLHPLTAGASGGNDALCARKHLSAADDGKAFLRLADLLHRRIEMKLHLGGQLLVQVLQHDIVYIGSEMPHRSIQKVQPVLEAHLFDVAVGSGVQRGSLPSVGKVDLIDIFHQVDRLLFADILVQSAAELVRDVVFAVRECARSAEAVHDGTGLATHAGCHFHPINGAFPPLQRVSGFKNCYAQFRSESGQFISGENAAGACADNDNVVLVLMIHGGLPFWILSVLFARCALAQLIVLYHRYITGT